MMKCRGSICVWKMCIKLRELIDGRLENMRGRSCPCFPRRRRKVNSSKNNKNEEEQHNLKPSVQKVQNEQRRQSTSKQVESQAITNEEESKVKKRKGESQTSSPSSSKVDIPPDAIVNKGREFSYQELANATNNFRKDAFLGEGGFGRVYKGQLESTKQLVAVKTLNREGVQGNDEFQVEVTMLSLVYHPNIVTLIGYCSERDQRLLVYEFMPFGSLEQHLHYPKPNMKPLDWNTRMKIAIGTARGLDYLHNHCKPRIIYRDMKPANILLGEGYHPKISDLGLAKFGPTEANSHVSTRVMGTMGYCAPEYGFTGQLTAKSDTYSFGVVLLEIVTGRKALERTSDGEQFLIEWAKPMLTDKKTYVKLADPKMKIGKVMQRAVRKAIELALMCMNNDHRRRPDMSEVVDALDFVASLGQPPEDQRAKEEDGERMMLKNKEEERAKAVAEAKIWGEQCRQDAEKIVSHPLTL